MGMLKMLIGGIVGGLVGAAIWAAIGYYSGYEVGWIAWGIGFLVGLGVKLTGSQEIARFDKLQRKMVVERAGAEGPVAGAIAAAVAVLAVLVAKYAVVHLLVSAPDSMAGFLDDEIMISFIADEIVAEEEIQGRPVQWPAGVDPDDAYAQEDYPPQIWSQAASRWNSMTPEQKEEQKALQAAFLGEAFAEAGGAAAGAVFLASFGLFDLLWFGLAAVTAFKIGASGSE